MVEEDTIFLTNVDVLVCWPLAYAVDVELEIETEEIDLEPEIYSLFCKDIKYSKSLIIIAFPTKKILL